MINTDFLTSDILINVVEDGMIFLAWAAWVLFNFYLKQNKLKLVILGHFLPFVPLKSQKIKLLKNGKICRKYHHFTHVHQKLQSYDVRFLRYGVRQTKKIVILCHFLPFYHHHLLITNIKILKKKLKNGSRYYLFMHTCVP